MMWIYCYNVLSIICLIFFDLFTFINLLESYWLDTRSFYFYKYISKLLPWYNHIIVMFTCSYRMLYWCHWQWFDKFSTCILSLIWFFQNKPHWWWSGERACLECGRSCCFSELAIKSNSACWSSTKLTS